jgi:hypothetical protein
VALLQHCKVKKSSYGHQFSSVSSRYNDENSRCGAVTVSDFNPVKAGDSHTEAPHAARKDQYTKYTNA